MKSTFALLSVALSLFYSGVALEGKSLTANQSQFTKEPIMESYNIVQKPSMIIMEIECKTSNAPEAGPHDIPKHWGRFYSENIIDRIPNKTSREVIALYCDYEGDYTQPYSLVIGCPVSSFDAIPQGMVAKIIPAGSYAVFRAIGEHPKTLLETWTHIWQQGDLDRAYTGDYEVYGDKFLGSPQEVEVFISLMIK